MSATNRADAASVESMVTGIVTGAPVVAAREHDLVTCLRVHMKGLLGSGLLGSGLLGRGTLALTDMVVVVVSITVITEEGGTVAVAVVSRVDHAPRQHHVVIVVLVVALRTHVVAKDIGVATLGALWAIPSVVTVPHVVAVIVFCNKDATDVRNSQATLGRHVSCKLCRLVTPAPLVKGLDLLWNLGLDDSGCVGGHGGRHGGRLERLEGLKG